MARRKGGKKLTTIDIISKGRNHYFKKSKVPKYGKVRLARYVINKSGKIAVRRLKGKRRSYGGPLPPRRHR